MGFFSFEGIVIIPYSDSMDLKAFLLTQLQEGGISNEGKRAPGGLSGMKSRPWVVTGVPKALQWLRQRGESKVIALRVNWIRVL